MRDREHGIVRDDSGSPKHVDVDHARRILDARDAHAPEVGLDRLQAREESVGRRSVDEDRRIEKIRLRRASDRHRLPDARCRANRAYCTNSRDGGTERGEAVTEVRAEAENDVGQGVLPTSESGFESVLA